MVIKNIRTFIPTKDFKESKEYYLELGFNVLWEGKDLIILGDENNNFFLQDYYNEDWANNFMMQIHVEDLNDTYETANKLTKKYPQTRIKEIFEADYGRTFHLIGPAGELWHFTEYNKK